MFQIELVTQNPEKVYEARDPLSMGRMRVVIDGVEVWNGDSNLSSCALRLLRTIDADFAGPVNDKVYQHELILHACGFLPFEGCPIGVSWRVLHTSDSVHVDRVMRALAIGEDEFVAGISEPAIVAHADYAREVRAFAAGVRDGIFSDTTRLVDDPSQAGFAQLFKEFWAEYDRLLFGVNAGLGA